MALPRLGLANIYFKKCQSYLGTLGNAAERHCGCCFTPSPRCQNMRTRLKKRGVKAGISEEADREKPGGDKEPKSMFTNTSDSSSAGCKMTESIQADDDHCLIPPQSCSRCLISGLTHRLLYTSNVRLQVLQRIDTARG